MELMAPRRRSVAVDVGGIVVGSVLPRATARLELSAGSVDAPWVASFAGQGPLRVCTGS